MNRHHLLPLLLIGAVGIPFLVYETGLVKSQNADPNDTMTSPVAGISAGYQANTANRFTLSPQTMAPTSVPNLTNRPPTAINPRVINPAVGPATIPSALPRATTVPPAAATGYRSGGLSNSAYGNSAYANRGASTLPATPIQAIPFSGNQVILPGNAAGPDLNAQPLEFLPIGNLEEIVRFDVYPNWVKSRWKRVSTAATDYGLHGLRVALVTGVNPGDLHGSLTYYFDSNQHLQRISFRGWTGDATRLVDLLIKKYQFKPQQTHMSGLYLAKNWRHVTGALLLQHPTVIRSETPNKQVAVSFELNKPNGPFILSHQFASLLPKEKN